MKTPKISIKTNRLLLVLAFIMAFSVKIVSAQTIITVTEHDEDNKYLDKKGQPRANYINRPIVDINSTLQIELNKALLKTKMADSAGFVLPVETQKLLSLLLTALTAQKAALAKYSVLVKNYNPANTDNAKDFNNAVADVTQPIYDVIGDPGVKAFLSNDPKGGFLPPIYEALSKRADQIKNAVVTGNAATQPTIQLGAWINTGGKQIPLHLSGFDSIAQQNYFTVQRWQFLPTKDQLNQLQQLQQAAKENKDVNLSISKDAFDSYLKTLFADQLKFGADALNDITNQLQNIRGDIITANIPAGVSTLKNDYQVLVTTINAKVDQYKSLSVTAITPDMIAQLITDVTTINAQITKLKTDCAMIIRSVNTLKGQVLADAMTLKNTIQNKADGLFSSLINSDLLSQLQQGYQLDVSALDFTDKVLKLSFSATPVSTELDLHNTGNRKEGDQIIFKLKVAANGKDEYTEARVINMYAVLLHVQGTVGVIFAHPTSHTQLVNNFQVVPYYNLLFKGLWPFGENYRRRSVINDKFWDLSWGVHFSSPDFDKDDIPEVGGGIVLSGIKDYFQVGYANDFFLNKWYVFFGVRLPLPFLSSGNGATGQTNN